MACRYLIERRQVKLFGDELLEVQDGGLCRAADPLAFQTSELAAVALQADADLVAGKQRVNGDPAKRR